jgi:PqqD family protein of HPr-rel-A system
LRWAAWEDGCIVFQVRSGETHYLNPTGAYVLQALVSAPADESQLARQLGLQLGRSAADEEILAHIDALLARFQELGLIEPKPTLEGR